MICFTKNCDGDILKWNIDFDAEDLINIKSKLIAEFGTVISHDEKAFSCKEPTIKNSLIMNFCAYKIKSIEDDYNYRIMYDEYKCPQLVFLIDRMLKGDVSAAFEIEDSFETGKGKISREINALSESIDSIDNFDVDKKIKKLNELKKLLTEEEKITANPLYKYYEMASSVINIQFLGKLDQSIVEEILDFFECDSFDKMMEKNRK